MDGVNFDLTHKNLDAENWLPPMFNDLPEKPVNAPLVSVVRSARQSRFVIRSAEGGRAKKSTVAHRQVILQTKPQLQGSYIYRYPNWTVRSVRSCERL
jgi:hypothetical protein